MITELKTYAEEFKNAPAIIRSAVDPVFIEETKPWLEAMELWGESLVLTAEGLQAAMNSNTKAKNLFEKAAAFAERATEIKSIPGATRFDGKIKIADGVLDVFIKNAPGLITF